MGTVDEWSIHRPLIFIVTGAVMDIIKKTEELVSPILEEHGFSLYDIEYIDENREKILRVYIDKDDGITSDDTALVCRFLSDRIDKEKSFINEAYTLEVSSPGITRALKKPEHFIKSIGKDVEFKLFSPISYTEGGKEYKAREFIGILKGYEKETDIVTVDINDQEITFKRSDLASIHLWIDF